MRLIFMGTPQFSVPTLHALHGAGHEIAAVYTRAPAASGRRGKDLRPSPVHAAADALGLELRTPSSLRREDEIEAFRALGADAAVVVAYGRILPPAVLDAVPLGAWNAHASLLPRWRGAAPINRAVMARDAETGVQVMRMEEGLDTGPVALTHTEPIGPTTTAGDLFETLAEAGARLVVEAMGRLEAGTLETVPQSESGVTYADKIAKDEARIDWTRPASEIASHINGLSPFPGAWTVLDGQRVKLLRAQFVEGGKFIPQTAQAPDPGTIDRSFDAMSLSDSASVPDGTPVPPVVLAARMEGGTRHGVALLEVQRAGGRPVTGAEFARSLPEDARFE